MGAVLYIAQFPKYGPADAVRVDRRTDGPILHRNSYKRNNTPIQAAYIPIRNKIRKQKHKKHLCHNDQANANLNKYLNCNIMNKNADANAIRYNKDADPHY